jgi:hypothetical protein
MNALLRAGCRRHLAALDRIQADRAQTGALLGLIHRARSTPFGRDHDFARMRTPGDFRRLVPLRTLDELWQRHGRLDGMSWPGTARQLVPCRDHGDGPQRFLPLSSALQAAHRAANQMALALVQEARPQAAICSGSVVFLRETLSAARLAEGKLEVAASLTARHLPWPVRPYAVSGATLSDVARAAARTNLTCLGGPVSALLKLLAEVKRCARRDSIADVWPNLTAVVWSRKPADPPASLLRAEVGDQVLRLEIATRLDSPVAVEDPQSGLLRSLPGHGVYYEFVPTTDTNRRLSLDQVETGVAYELVLTSPAGLWACRTGETVCFESRTPPLFRFVGVCSQEKAISTTQSASEPAVPTPNSELRTPNSPIQPPHRRSAGIPAAPPGTPAHSSWLTPADRG